MDGNVLIVGAGPGLSASLAKKFKAEGMDVALAARNTDKLTKMCSEADVQAFKCDATKVDDVCRLFDQLQEQHLTPDVVVYNAGYRVPSCFVDLDPQDVQNALQVNAFGAMLVAQAAAKAMLDKGQGSILFTGASAGVKGYANSAAFAMGKFALRGLCQSLARELAPQNIHVAHIIIDGLIQNNERGVPFNDPDKTLNPDEIANTYYALSNQDKSAWTWELELRPSVEIF